MYEVEEVAVLAFQNLSFVTPLSVQELTGKAHFVPDKYVALLRNNSGEDQVGIAAYHA